jgi:hypothetical protein
LRFALSEPICSREQPKPNALRQKHSIYSTKNSTRKVTPLSPNQLVPIAGVSMDKLLALRGDPSLHIAVDHQHSHIHANIQPASLEDIRNALLARKKLIDQQQKENQPNAE